MAKMLEVGAAGLERGAERLHRGDLGSRPWRDPLQAWWVRTVTGPRFPRGGKAIRAGVPAPQPEQGRALEALRQAGARYRAVASQLTPEQRSALWIWNPFAPWLRWHYTLAELILVQTTHARHHARLASEATAV